MGANKKVRLSFWIAVAALTSVLLLAPFLESPLLIAQALIALGASVNAVVCLFGESL